MQQSSLDCSDTIPLIDDSIDLRPESPRSVWDAPQNGTTTVHRISSLRKRIAMHHKIAKLPSPPIVIEVNDDDDDDDINDDTHLHVASPLKRDEADLGSDDGYDDPDGVVDEDVMCMNDSPIMKRRSSSWKIRSRLQKMVRSKGMMKGPRKALRNWSSNELFSSSKSLLDVSEDDNIDAEQQDEIYADSYYGSDTASSSSETPDSTSMSSSSHKQVRFRLDSDGKIQAETMNHELLHLTEDEVDNMWWSKKDRRIMKRQAHALATSFISMKSDYRSAIEQLLLKCGKESGPRLHCAVPSEVPVDRFSYEEALRIAVNHDARGLEQAMVNMLNLQSCRFYYRCGQSSVGAVLKAQAAAQELVGVSSDTRSALIALNLRQCSGFVVQFARILAEGDALVASGAYGDPTAEAGDAATTCATTLGDMDEENQLISDALLLDFSPPVSDDFLLNELCQL